MVLVQSSPHFIPHQVQIGELAKAHRLPTMFLNRFYVETGGLLSYRVDFPPMYRRAAEYVAKILKGTKPADLPVEQATKFEMVINLKTAKARSPVAAALESAREHRRLMHKGVIVDLLDEEIRHVGARDERVRRIGAGQGLGCSEFDYSLLDHRRQPLGSVVQGAVDIGLAY
jgi:hypothetical protein